LNENSEDKSDNSCFKTEARSAGAFLRFNPYARIFMKTGMIPKQEVFDTKSKITSEINSLKYEINSKNSDENSDDNLSSSESEYEEPILDRFKKIEDIRQQKMSIMGRKEHQKKILIGKKILSNDDTEELKDT